MFLSGAWTGTAAAIMVKVRGKIPAGLQTVPAGCFAAGAGSLTPIICGQLIAADLPRPALTSVLGSVW